MQLKLIKSELTTDNTLSSARSSFATKFSTLIWVVTTGASFFLVWWYRRVPVFYVPAGWVPGPVSWLLAFPGAPKGELLRFRVADSRVGERRRLEHRVQAGPPDRRGDRQDAARAHAR